MEKVERASKYIGMLFYAIADPGECFIESLDGIFS